MSASLLHRFFPFLAVLGSVTALGIGTSWAKHWLVPVVGAQGTTAVRVGLSALLMLMLWRPWRWRLSRADAAVLAALRDAVGRGWSPAALGWKLGAEGGRDAVLLRAALLESPLPTDWQTDVARGAASVMPVTAIDLMPDLQGAALGARFGLDSAHLCDPDKLTFYTAQGLVWQRGARIGASADGMPLLEALLG